MLQPALRTLPRASLRFRAPLLRLQTLHTTSTTSATPIPITVAGPPPKAPLPPTTPLQEFRARQALTATNIASKKRFWKTVEVAKKEHGYEIHLDKRVLKTPLKNPLHIPLSKPLLAHGIALEWSLLRSSKDATLPHLLPLTQMASRALDWQIAETTGKNPRESMIETCLNYLTTDTILCIDATPPMHYRDPDRPMLREVQMGVAEEYMHVVAGPGGVLEGVELKIVDGDAGFVTTLQPGETRERAREWVQSLSTWEFVGFERCMIAGKSFLVGARMVSEWGNEGRQTGEKVGKGENWGVEEAARSCELEVEYQTGRWGEVEDTHDVAKEDLRRNIGAGWMLISEQEGLDL